MGTDTLFLLLGLLRVRVASFNEKLLDILERKLYV